MEQRKKTEPAIPSLFFALSFILCIFSTISCRGHELPLIIRDAHSIQLIDCRINISVKDCQKITVSCQNSNKRLQQKAYDHLSQGEWITGMRELCKQYGQKLVVLSLAFSNDGCFVAASLVFPGKEEMDTKEIPDSFLNEAYLRLKDLDIPSWKEGPPYVIVTPIAVKVFSSAQCNDAEGWQNKPQEKRMEPCSPMY